MCLLPRKPCAASQRLDSIRLPPAPADSVVSVPYLPVGRKRVQQLHRRGVKEKNEVNGCRDKKAVAPTTALAAERHAQRSMCRSLPVPICLPAALGTLAKHPKTIPERYATCPIFPGSKTLKNVVALCIFDAKRRHLACPSTPTRTATKASAQQNIDFLLRPKVTPVWGRWVDKGAYLE